jgi:hypothetical protein
MDYLKTPSDFRKETKDKQILYLRNEIAKLEYMQLSESIVSIKGKQTAEKLLLSNGETSRKHGTKKKKLYSEYEITFDKTINVASTCVDESNVKLLAKYRADILLTSLYDATLASSLQLKSISSFANTDQGKNNKKPAENESKPIKQIGDLFDQDILGREIDFKQYGLCHHCKQINPRSQLVKCNYKSARAETEPGKSVGSAATYKGRHELLKIHRKKAWTKIACSSSETQENNQKC